MAKAEIVITLKPTLLDAQGATIKTALQNLGYANVQDVRVGKVVELEIGAAAAGDADALRSEITRMCDQLLANPIIEDYRVELL